jgi:hypothetical protein
MASRFLPVAVDRSKLLPFGGTLDHNHLVEIGAAVRLAHRFAVPQRALALESAARERWATSTPNCPPDGRG